MKCPKCGTEREYDAPFCGECGFKFEDVSPEIKTYKKTKILYCPSCGSKYIEGDGFCNNCGCDLKQEGRKQQDDEEEINCHEPKSDYDSEHCNEFETEIDKRNIMIKANKQPLNAKNVNRNQNPQVKEKKFCISCKKYFITARKHCPVCNEKLIKKNQKALDKKETCLCPYCGEEILATAKKCKHCGEMLDDSSGYNNYPRNSKELPYELQRFNWGAFLWQWIWGIGNNSYLTLWSLIVYIPFIGWIAIIPLCIWFGIKGNEWAWNNGQWESIEHFNSVQKKWVVAYFIGALILTIICILYSLLVMIGMFSYFESNS